MAKKQSAKDGFFSEEIGDTMHDPARLNNARIRAERIYMVEFMTRQLEKATAEGNSRLAETCQRIIDHNKEMLGHD